MKKYITCFLTLVLSLALAAGSVQSFSAAEAGTDFSTAGHNYRLVISDCTWMQAFQRAKEAGGHLAVFESADEFNSVVNHISQIGFTNILFQIGGRRDPGSSQYYWVNRDNSLTGAVLNDPGSWAFSYWMSGEPSFQDGDVQESCMDLFFYKNEGRWVLNDIPDNTVYLFPEFSGRMGYIIEFEDAAPPAGASSWQDACYDFIFNQRYLEDSSLQFGDELSGSLSGVSFALRDMNADGTPELIIFNGDQVYAGSVSYLYQFSGSSVLYVDMMPGSNYNLYACVDELSLPGVFCSGAHTGAYWTDYYTFNGYLVKENVWTGEIGPNTDSAAGEAVTHEISRTSNETLYRAFQLIQNDENGTKLPFSTLEEIRQLGWDGWLGNYGYAASSGGSSTAAPVSDGSFSDPSAILPYVPDNYYFSSGAGAWATEMSLRDDGTFDGGYHDSNMGEDNEHYIGGVMYVSNFYGSFTDFQKVDDYTWSMRLASLDYENPVNSDWSDGEVHYIASEAYGLSGGDLFYLYLPGHPIDTLPEGFMSWARMYMNYEDPSTLTIYGIYNVNQELGWGGSW